MEDSLVYFGDTVKALDGEPGRVGGLAVRHKDESRKDFAGDFFDAETYLGAREGDGCDVLFHHGQPIGKGFEEFTEHIFAPVKATRDNLGLFVEHVLDLSDAFEKKVYELVKAGKLSYSTGSAGHMVKRDKNGHLKRWPIIEVSLTPTPCDFENKVIPIKSLSAVKHVSLDDSDADPAPPAKAVDGERLFIESLRQTEQQTWELWSAVQTGARKIVEAALAKDVTGVDVDVRQAVGALVGAYSPKLVEAIVSQVTDYLNSEVREDHFYLKSIFDELTPEGDEARAASKFSDHLEVVLAAAREVNQRAKSIQGMRVKAGRVLSEANRTRLAKLLESLQACAEDIGALLADAEPKPMPTKTADILSLLATFEHTSMRIDAAPLES